MVEFDRVFDRDDVMVAVLVQIVDAGGQRRRLAGTGRPGHEHQPSRAVEQLLQGRRRPQLLHAQQIDGNLPQHHPRVAPLLEDRDAEPGLVAEGEAEVGPPLLLQFLLAPFRRDALHQRNGVLRLEHLGFELHEPAVKAQNRRLPHGDVQVAGATVDHREQQFIDQNRPHKLLPCAGASPSSPGRRHSFVRFEARLAGHRRRPPCQGSTTHNSARVPRRSCGRTRTSVSPPTHHTQRLSGLFANCAKKRTKHPPHRVGLLSFVNAPTLRRPRSRFGFS